MEQHPIPQNVTTYEFHLVGDMTLKQFLELAGGVLAAFIITRFTVFPVILRWPMAGVFTFLGIALAFLPVEERPLDQWLKNFIKSIYSPTQFLWKKAAAIPDYFNFTPGKLPPLPTRVKPKDRAQFLSFARTFQPPPPSPIDLKEVNALKKINLLLGIRSIPLPISSVPQPSLLVSPGIKARPLRTPRQIKKEDKITFQQKISLVTKPQLLAQKQPLKKIVPFPKPTPPPATKSKSRPVVEFVQLPSPPLRISSLYPDKRRYPRKTVDPVFAEDLPLPSAPSAPNLITGMVLTSDNRLLPNSIVEIRNQQGQTVRAVKTNKLGQFFIATPLLNGDYEINLEHPEEAFDIIKFKVEGKIIPPIKIRAQKKAQGAGNQEINKKWGS